MKTKMLKVHMGLLAVMLLVNSTIMAAIQGCGIECRTSLDCQNGRLCRRGTCTRSSLSRDHGGSGPHQEPISIKKSSVERNTERLSEQNSVERNAERGIEQDSVEPSPERSSNPDTDRVSNERAPKQKSVLPKPQPGMLFIKEVLFDPPSGAKGDANKDGKRSASEDDFIEMVNATQQDLDLSDLR
ncbi:MAG: hypothetical protein AAGJ35_12895, partial [Myxococcota bacterium]